MYLGFGVFIPYIELAPCDTEHQKILNTKVGTLDYLFIFLCFLANSGFSQTLSQSGAPQAAATTYSLEELGMATSGYPSKNTVRIHTFCHISLRGFS